MWTNWILIGLLAVTTYISRIIGIEVMKGRKASSTLRLYFNYVPAGILSALVVSQLFISKDSQIQISFPIIIGGLVTALTIKISKSFLPSVIVGIVSGLLIRNL